MTAAPQTDVLYVDPYGGGHHSEYLGFFIRACHASNIRVGVVAPQAVWKLGVQLAEECSASAFHAADENLRGAAIKGRLRFLNRVGKLAAAQDVKLIHFATLDPLLTAAAIHLMRHSFGRAWSALLFHDSFNYMREELGRPAALFKSLARLATLKFALSRGARMLFTLNPRWRARVPVKVVWLADAMSSLDRMARRKGSIWPLPQEPEKAIGHLRLLLYGTLKPRKGILKALSALRTLSNAELQRIEFRMAGQFSGPDAFRDALAEGIAALRQRGASIDLFEGYVSEAEIDQALRWCDVVMAPYVDHVGSSGVMNVSAGYGRPVVSQANYQMGQQVRENDLGIALNTKDIDAIAGAIRQLLEKPFPANSGMDAYRTSIDPARAMQAFQAAITNVMNGA